MVINRLVVLLLLIGISTSLHAQRFNTKRIHDSLRHGNWEAGLVTQYQNSSDLLGEQGSSIEIDGTWGWGFALGYNLSSRWHFGYRFTMNKPDYSATIVPEEPEEPDQTIDYQMTKYAHAFNATFHFFDGPLTPYLQAGVGWTKLDSNIINRPPVTGCWWDPWWGYICSTSWTTYDTSAFSYNAGLGLRWDLNSAFFTRMSYNREWVDLDAGSMDFDTLSLEAGLMW
jgi:opacity protein-like surface antigen